MAAPSIRICLPRLIGGIIIHQTLHQVGILQRLQFRALFIIHSARMAALHILEIPVIIALGFQLGCRLATMAGVRAII